MCLQHIMVMEDMLKDFLLGEHLLLVGNQVGKISNACFVLLVFLLFTKRNLFLTFPIKSDDKCCFNPTFVLRLVLTEVGVSCFAAVK